MADKKPATRVSIPVSVVVIGIAVILGLTAFLVLEYQSRKGPPPGLC